MAGRRALRSTRHEREATVISKTQLIESMRHESKTLQHLHRCLPAGSLEYRPSPAQRSTEELLRYLTVSAIIPAVYTQTGNWDHAVGMSEKTQELDLDRFAEAMDEQMAGIEAALADVTDEELGTKEITMPFGTPCMLGEGLMNMCVKALTAYRMQLFLYVKACGNHDVGSFDCWAGMAAPKQ